jgi:hypothetical protein
VLSTVCTYAVFVVDSRRMGFRGRRFVRHPTAAQVTGHAAAVVVLAAVVAAPGFNAIHENPAILATIPIALATGVHFVVVSSVRLGEDPDAR